MARGQISQCASRLPARPQAGRSSDRPLPSSHGKPRPATAAASSTPATSQAGDHRLTAALGASCSCLAALMSLRAPIRYASAAGAAASTPKQAYFAPHSPHSASTAVRVGHGCRPAGPATASSRTLYASLARKAASTTEDQAAASTQRARTPCRAARTAT